MNRSIIFLLPAVFANASFGEALKDPHTRDENIAGTVVIVDVTQHDSGLYEYVYTLDSPTTNLGTIAEFSLDISCIGVSTIDLGMPMAASYSGDRNHLPVSMSADYGNAFMPVVDASNHASWGTQLVPGKKITGLRLFSAEPPGPRTYELVPSMDIFGWAYTEESELDPTIPWTEDFTVTGTIQGPRCPTDESNGGSGGNGKFAGTRVEPFGINALLTYDTPESDPVSTGDTLTLTIHYDHGIDPATFEAKLDGKSIANLFSPKAGKSETVQIGGVPSGRSKLHLSAMGTTTIHPRGKSEDHRQDERDGNPAVENRARQPNEHKSKDNDIFHLNNVE